MDFLHIFQIYQVIEKLCHIKFFRGCFHQYNHTVSENRDCSKQAQKCEDHCAGWICVDHVRILILTKINDKGCNNHTNTLNDISQNVDHSSSNVHVFMVMVVIMTSDTVMVVTFFLLFLSISMVVIVIVVMFVAVVLMRV